MIKTGCCLDNLIECYKDEITTIYGPAATGKTTLAKLGAIEQIRQGKKVVFIDTENGFNVERFNQLSKDKSLLNNIFLFRVRSFKEQCKRIKDLEGIKNISLIIIDTIGSLYRLEINKGYKEINNALLDQLNILRGLSKKIPIILTNQVYENEHGINVVGGKIIRNISKCLIKLEKNPRRFVLEKPCKKELMFDIKENGIFQK